VEVKVKRMEATPSFNGPSFNGKIVLKVMLFLAVAVVGLYIVKWDPYFHKSFIAAQKHSIGSSIVSGKSNVAPAPSWHTAWAYSVAYYKAIWKALVVGMLLGTLVQTLVPRDWLAKVLGRSSFKSTAVAGVAALPGMM